MFKLTTTPILISFFAFTFFSCKQEKAQITDQKEATAVTSLKTAADFPVGGAISIRRIQQDSATRQILNEQFNSITATNDMKMHSVLREDGTFNWERVDKLVNFAESHQHRLFGHTLVWHSATPEWVEAQTNGDPDKLDAFMKNYIQTFVGKYKGKVAGWDVVNEVMNTHGGGYRETYWYKTLGKAYVEKAFQYAHEADPDADLFYNDFNIERDTAKLHTALKMIEDLKAKNIPITGLGFQMHIRMDIPDSVIAYALKKGAETGLKIHLSEVDIIFNKHDDSQGGGIQVYETITDELLEAQKEKYRNLVEMYKSIVPKAQQYGITLWGFNDRDTWINGFFNLEDKPCIYDENLKPKPAYYGMLEGLKN
ncbi:endo-1,4-beta-xylanase [Flexithrix dorotheae]|uniref:endo-1,4-beta-xylanase n=1 Tax=Flexithrix dorotheae TaxID=70993 RepID=UPI000368A802|nr:endo-1,4-beta-xylanase [Flexithrix dorotheae]